MPFVFSTGELKKQRKMKEIKTFGDYLENLSTRHIDIKHSKEEMHYVDTRDEKNNSIDSTLCYPCVLLEKNSYKYVGSHISYQKDRDYLLFILDHVTDTGDYEQIENAINKSEQILDEFLTQMIEDKRSRIYPFLIGFNLDRVEVENICNKDNSLYGVAALLTVPVQFNVINSRIAFND